MAGFQIADAPVDVRATDFVQRGVRDTSTAEAITAVGKEGMNIFVGKQQAGIEQEVESEVGGFLSQAVDEGPHQVGDVPLDQSDLDLLSDSVELVGKVLCHRWSWMLG